MPARDFFRWDGSMQTERFKQLACETAREDVEWRPDGVADKNGGTRHVAFVSAQHCQDLLDQVCPGEWESRIFTIAPAADEDGELLVYVKCALTVMGVTRESIGAGKDWKSADTDAFKRSCVRFGIAADLYRFPTVRVYGKPYASARDCWAAYDKALERRDAAEAEPTPATPPAPSGAAPVPVPRQAVVYRAEPCPNCGSRVYDNSDKDPVAWPVLYKCAASCGYVVRRSKASKPGPAKTGKPVPVGADADEEYPPQLEDGQDDLPF